MRSACTFIAGQMERCYTGPPIGAESESMTLMREEETRRRREPRGQATKIYPAGTGSFYGRGEEPRYPAEQISSFGRAEGEPRPVRGPEGERRGWMDESKYPAGTGSYYSETSERPSSTAGPESYFGRTEGAPPRETRMETIAVSFPAGTGTVYVRREEPKYPPEQASSFGRVEGEPRERETILVTFPAGTGSVYAHREEPLYPPEETSSFGRVQGEPRRRRQ
jgi:hypothetical protein